MNKKILGFCIVKQNLLQPTQKSVNRNGGINVNLLYTYGQNTLYIANKMFKYCYQWISL
jgi:hypothetical protein